MSDAMLQKTIDLVSSLEVKNETQQLAKYELIEYTERLHEENQKYKEVIDKAIATIDECKLLMSHEFDWGEQMENIENILKKVE